MDNEKELMGTETEEVVEALEETTEALEEISADAVEEVAEMTEEATEEVQEEAIEEAPPKKTLSKVYLCDECGAICETEICPVCQKELTVEEAYVCKAQTAVDKNKKIAKNVVIAVLSVAAVVLLFFAGRFVYTDIYNPYNHTEEYKDINFGDTIADQIKEYDVSLKEFLEASNLPSDMAKSTYLYVAKQFVTVADAIEGSGMTAQDYITQIIGMEGEFDDDVTVGEIESKMNMRQMFGIETEEELAQVKATYDLKDDVTLDTVFKDIRAQVYKKAYETEQKQKAEEKTE